MIPTDLEITLEFLDSPTEVDFFTVAGAPGHDGQDGADGAPGRDGADGHTPVITASKQGNTTTISVDGNPVAQILDGATGAKGDKGDPGQDGAKGDKGDTGAKGDKGDKGDTGAQGIQGIQGEKGETGAKGDKGDKGDTGATGAAGQDGYTPVKGIDYWTAEDKAEIVEEAAKAVDVPVTDVQVNGTSILSSGVANIPKAGYGIFGVVRVTGNDGVRVASNGDLCINTASDATYKAGTNQYACVTARVQDISTFYGLAKAAGDSTQSVSSNTVGNYTDAAKVAIQKMLGIYEPPWELIREDTFTNATEATHEITIDSNGQAFELTDAILLFETPVQATDAAKGDYGSIRFYNGSTTIAMTYSNAWTQTANAAAHGTWSMVESKDGLVFISARTQGASTNMGSMSMPYQAGFGNTQLQGIQSAENFSVTKVSIPKVTGTGHYKFYGKRKWQ